MKIFKIALSASTLALVACGGGEAKLDSTNTDTLRTTIGEVMGPLSQSDRMKAGAAIRLLVENPTPSDVDYEELKFADEDAGLIIDITGDSSGARIDADLFVGNMVRDAEGRLNGKTASDLIGFRDAALSGAFSNSVTAFEKMKAEIQPAQQKLESQVAKYKDTQTSLADKRGALRSKGLKYVKDNKLKLKLHTNAYFIESEGDVVLNNPTSKTINRADVWTEIWLKSTPDQKNFSSVTRPIFGRSITIGPGASGTYRYVAQNRFRNMFPSGAPAPSDLSEYGSQVVVGHVYFADGSEDVFYLPGKELATLEAIPGKLKACQAQIEALDKTSSEIDAHLAKLAAQNLDALQNAPRFRRKDKC